MGRSSNQFSFSNFSGDTYVTNGGRPHVARRGKLTTTGMSAPASTPDVETSIDTNWKEVSFNTSGSADNDLTLPADITNSTVSTRTYKLNLPGTGYIEEGGTGHVWAKDEYFCFKCQVKFRRVDGRISLISNRTSTRNGGPFLEVVDGKVRFGWYDTELQKDVYVETSKEVVEPGYWYYIAVRKRYPSGGTVGNVFTNSDNTSNWQNATVGGDAMAAGGTSSGAYADALVVRRFADAAQSVSDYNAWTGIDAKEFEQITNISGANFVAPFAVESSARMFVSFPTNADATFTSATDTRLGADWEDHITVPGIVWTGDVASGDSSGRITFNTTGLLPLVRDYIGMWLQIKEDSGTDFKGKLYRIVDIYHNDDSTLADSKVCIAKVIDEDGATPNLTALHSNDNAAICCGVNLVKSDGFDDSLRPDPTAYKANVCGEALASSAINGYTQFDGEVASFAWGWYSGAVGSTHSSDKVFLVKPFEDADQKTQLVGWFPLTP